MSFDLNQPIKGKVWKFGDSVDTDCIYPEYRYTDPEELRKHTMESARHEFAQQVKPGDLIVAGSNFGCGSGRPAKVLYEVGIAAILADSLSTLFTRNCISAGDLVFAVPGVSNIVEDGQMLEINYRESLIKNLVTGKTLPMRKYPPMVEQIYEAGGMLHYAKAWYEAQANTSSGASHR